MTITYQFRAGSGFWTIVPSSTWLAFLMVYCCALSLGSSLFSEALRTSSLLGGRTHEFSSRRSYARVLFAEVSRMSSLLDLPLPYGWET